MSTRTRTIHCSQCGETGHNRRTCTQYRRSDEAVKNEKWLMTVSKIVPKKPEPKKHNCTICMCDIETEKDSMCLPCGHHFHVTCGLKWLQHNNTCPCCRAECGEKPKKLAVINENVAAALAGEIFNSSNILIDISQQNQSICEYPWNYPGYKQYVNTGYSMDSAEFIDYSEEELKTKWEEESPGTQIRLKCRFLYQHNAMSLGSMMMQGFASARLYQEGDFDLSEVLVNQAESGIIAVQIPVTATEAEQNDFDDMPELEENSDTDSYLSEASTLIDVNLDIQYPEISEQDLEDEFEEISNDLSLDNPMTIDELDTPLTAQAILDYHRSSDEDITEEEALEIIEVLTTPEPVPIQVPNAPIRRRGRRSELQSPPSSPRSVSDQHVTRRTSERIRQRYRRRRLQEESDTLYSDALEV